MIPARPTGLFGSTAAPEAPDSHAGLKRAAGIFADFAAGFNGRPGPYLAMQEQKRQEAERAAEEQRQLAQQYALYDYKRQNPMPANNDTINDVQWYVHASPEEKAAYDAMHPVYKIGADGLPYPIARPGAAPTAPVGKLTPLDDGGPAPQAPGMFP